MLKIKSNLRIVATIVACLAATSANGNNPSPVYSGRLLDIGIRNLSVQSLNDALKSEGLAELKPFAVNYSIGGTTWHKKFVFNGKITAFASRSKENSYNGILGVWFFNGLWSSSMEQ